LAPLNSFTKETFLHVSLAQTHVEILKTFWVENRQVSCVCTGREEGKREREIEREKKGEEKGKE
jgi:hypothetical protein